MTKSPTEMLEAEHRFIAKVVSAAGLLADKLEAGQPVEAQVFQNVVEFMRIYATNATTAKRKTCYFHCWRSVECRCVAVQWRR